MSNIFCGNAEFLNNNTGSHVSFDKMPRKPLAGAICFSLTHRDLNSIITVSSERFDL
ncbi:hypothetical protein CHUV0807_2072 [Cardiobacterium hominis]|uniref:Uncharacterized protein n=1 Tax=Cardiobacterium hominis TaxID=2718 RepID=A0A1C3H668_9GAMM|nr:hypothetical protein CHUV0807_2072 [Cardiobacterium hominis]